MEKPFSKRIRTALPEGSSAGLPTPVGELAATCWSCNSTAHQAKNCPTKEENPKLYLQRKKAFYAALASERVEDAKPAHVAICSSLLEKAPVLTPVYTPNPLADASSPESAAVRNRWCCWKTLPAECDLAGKQGGRLPEKRAPRKREQVENVIHYVQSLLKDGMTVVDFCSGCGQCYQLVLEQEPKALSNRPNLFYNRRQGGGWMGGESMCVHTGACVRGRVGACVRGRKEQYVLAVHFKPTTTLCVNPHSDLHLHPHLLLFCTTLPSSSSSSSSSSAGHQTIPLAYHCPNASFVYDAIQPVFFNSRTPMGSTIVPVTVGRTYLVPAQCSFWSVSKLLPHLG